MNFEIKVLEELKKETRRRLFKENLTRLQKCLSILNDEELWHRSNKNTVSAGNLVLHLTGNIRQWLLSGIGGEPDKRVRQSEFDEVGPLPAAELLDNLKSVLHDVDMLLDRLTPEDLIKKIEVQGFDESGLSIIVHVVEHFSCHVGQITYITKAKKNIDLKYCGDIDLDQTSPSQ